MKGTDWVNSNQY